MYKFALIVLIFCLGNVVAMAQNDFAISGVIKAKDGKPIEAATVFIADSKKITLTNDKGAYFIGGLTSGNYELVVKMIGYVSEKRNMSISGKSLVQDIKLADAIVALNEVTIKFDKKREEYLKIFREAFLGTTLNGEACEIENPEVLRFKSKTDYLNAKSDDFLIITNNMLGYRIKYLLKDFTFTRASRLTSFDGDCVFEELTGNPEERSKWIANRKTAYFGSFMHYLRSLFANNTEQNGFFTYAAVNETGPMKISTQPTNPGVFTSVVDSNFIKLELPRSVYVLYNQGITARLDYTIGSLLRPYLKHTLVDSKGNYVDYKSFYVLGFWGGKRIGDRLPFEYQP